MKTPTVIGEGTYGCVHKPTLKCKRGKHNYTRKVSKIMKTQNAKEEMEEYRNISSIDKKREYYLGKPELCEPRSDVPTKKAIAKCENAYKYKDPKDTRLLIMEDGGLHLKEYALKMAKMKVTPQNQEKMRTFWSEARRMILAVKDLLDHKMIHHDMKPENMVYDERIHRINLIDFGFLVDASKIRMDSAASKNWLSEMHWSYPPEIQFYNKTQFLKYASLTHDQKHDFVKKIAEDVSKKRENVFSDAWRVFFAYTLVDHRAHFKDFEEMLQSLKPREYSAFLAKSMDTIDLYGLGIAFVYVLQHTGHLLEDSLKHKLADLFSRMISSNVFQRIGVDELLSNYDDILHLCTIKTPTNGRFISDKGLKKQGRPLGKGDSNSEKEEEEEWEDKWWEDEYYMEDKKLQKNVKHCIEIQTQLKRAFKDFYKGKGLSIYFEITKNEEREFITKPYINFIIYKEGIENTKEKICFESQIYPFWKSSGLSDAPFLSIGSSCSILVKPCYDLNVSTILKRLAKILHPHGIRGLDVGDISSFLYENKQSKETKEFRTKYIYQTKSGKPFYEYYFSTSQETGYEGEPISKMKINLEEERLLLTTAEKGKIQNTSQLVSVLQKKMAAFCKEKYTDSCGLPVCVIDNADWSKLMGILDFIKELYDKLFSVGSR
jgi:serine/threonine protein kinase